MNKNKSIAVAVVLLLVVFVGGMLAYYTDTETKTNVFTIGNVNIQLNEIGWENTSESNYTRNEAINIVPGATIEKAPTVSNIGVNSAYVFLKVEVPYANVTVDGTKANQDIFTLNEVSSNWTEISNSNGVHVYAYGTSSEMTTLATSTTTEALFTGVTLKNLDNSEELGETPTNITVTAYGIQTSELGTTNPSDIYALFNN